MVNESGLARASSRWSTGRVTQGKICSSMPLYRKRTPVLKGPTPKKESRMFKLDKETSISLSREEEPENQIDIDEISVLNEVLDTIDRVQSDSNSMNEAVVFDRWLLSFQDQAHQFVSPVLVCEMKYNELLQVHSNYGEPFLDSYSSFA